MPKPIIDLSSRRFGRWFVEGRDGVTKQGWPQWRCRCECGTVRGVRGADLRLGKSKSCGCLVGEYHGRRDTPEYHTWYGMKNRCTNSRQESWKYYGQRGIKVCERWRNSFTAFLADVGPKPSPLHSIDRIDVNGDYGPGNVRWATPKEQANNQRCRIKVAA